MRRSKQRASLLKKKITRICIQIVRRHYRLYLLTLNPKFFLTSRAFFSFSLHHYTMLAWCPLLLVSLPFLHTFTTT
ncbi:hypothetical protein COCVIDRAFT_99639 [Bipolaris victoriae FI3]|uniref:Uncharacterized protein n=1 Tax=Bipolaris victoriae (strain FI3) TaxID=930091 RepID=W7EFG3_BIPV3|nr:hypothetical protein COCVIDRAFT_99639 [Bipolaris victoriae FI3]